MAHRIARDQVVWAFGPELEPVLEVDPGETVTFETNDCFTGQIRSEDDLVTAIDLSRINSATGPVAVRGAEPGDSLVVEILDVRPVEWGVATLIPGFGQLIDARAGAGHAALRGRGRRGAHERPRPLPGQADGRRRRRRDRRRGALERARGPARRQSRRPLPRHGRADLLPGAAAGRACSPSATCTRRWATARSASRASRSPARWTSASTSEGQAGDLAGDRARRPLAPARDRAGLRGRARSSSPTRRRSCSSTSTASRSRTRSSSSRSRATPASRRRASRPRASGRSRASRSRRSTPARRRSPCS